MKVISVLSHNGQGKRCLSLKSLFSLVLLIEIIATQKTNFNCRFRIGQMGFTGICTNVLPKSCWRMRSVSQGRTLPSCFYNTRKCNKGWGREKFFWLVAAGLKQLNDNSFIFKSLMTTCKWKPLWVIMTSRYIMWSISDCPVKPFLFIKYYLIRKGHIHSSCHDLPKLVAECWDSDAVSDLRG